MTSLQDRHCEACHSGSVPLNKPDIQQLLADLDGWEIVQQGKIDRLVKTFRFADFKTAFRFAAAITELAEQEDHHPMLTVEWGKTSVQWWTHAVDGLHLNDFIMAAKSDLAVQNLDS